MKRVVLSAAVLCLFCGCSGGGASTVTGKVTLDDGSAAPRGSVTLRNDAGSFRGAIESDGTYTIENVADGDYEVAVAGVTDQEPGDPNEGMAFDQETGKYADSKVEAPASLIDFKYTNPSTSGLKISVPSQNYDLTLERAGDAPSQ